MPSEVGDFTLSIEPNVYQDDVTGERVEVEVTFSPEYMEYYPDADGMVSTRENINCQILPDSDPPVASCSVVLSDGYVWITGLDDAQRLADFALGWYDAL